MKTFYYSLKTTKEEHRLEKRIGGDFDYAIYDLKQNLLKPKELIKKNNAVEFLWGKQKELKGNFEKIETKEEVKEEVKEEKKEYSPAQDIIEKFIGEASKKGFIKNHEETTSTKTDKVSVNRNTIVMSGKGKSGTYLNHDDECVLIARLDKRTGDITVEVQNETPASPVESHNQYRLIIDKLFFGVVTSMPQILENHLCSSLAKFSGISYEEAITQFRKQKSLKLKSYKHITEMLSTVVDVYKKDVEEEF